MGGVVGVGKERWEGRKACVFLSFLLLFLLACNAKAELQTILQETLTLTHALSPTAPHYLDDNSRRLPRPRFVNLRRLLEVDLSRVFERVAERGGEGYGRVLSRVEGDCAV